MRVQIKSKQHSDTFTEVKMIEDMGNGLIKLMWINQEGHIIVRNIELSQYTVEVLEDVVE